MADISSNFIQGLLPDLGREPSKEGGLRHWLSGNAYVPSYDGIAKKLTLANIRRQDLAPYLGHDFERFALASAESFFVASSEWDSHNICGWPLLKLYYSAFFAAHALMRSQGWGFAQLGQSEITHINDFMDLMNPGSSKIEAGALLFRVTNQAQGQVTVAMTKPRTSLGVHDGFWKSFCDFLNQSANEAVEAAEVGSETFASGVSDVIRSLEGGTSNKGWMSKVRNEINYQHRYAVWRPNKKSDRTATSIAGVQHSPSSGIPLLVRTGKTPIPAFVRAANYLAMLNMEVAANVGARSKTGRSFGQKWRRLCETFP